MELVRSIWAYRVWARSRVGDGCREEAVPYMEGERNLLLIWDVTHRTHRTRNLQVCFHSNIIRTGTDVCAGFRRERPSCMFSSVVRELSSP